MPMCCGRRVRIAALVLAIAVVLVPLASGSMAAAPRASAGTHHHKRHHRRHHKRKRHHRRRHRRHVSSQPVTSTPPAPVPPAAPTAPASGNPFAGARFYVDPSSDAAKTQQQWAASGRSSDAALIGKVASQPSAEWFGDWTYGHGGTAGDVSWWVSRVASAGALPVLVAYDLPWRDCSQYSSGGAASPAAYQSFIDQMAQGIGAHRAVVILEPDALAELACLSSDRQSAYYSLLQYGVTHLGANPLVSVYLDSGNAGWQSAATMATRLRAAGVSAARGFALNVSNFDTTQSEIAYGAAIVQALGTGSHFLIDTSRNGQGPAPGGAWCNPPGRGLGVPPTAQTASSLVDAYFWVKRPGESDGTCNGGPSAGTWWPEYALGLAQNAVF
jgi:endoglucanase